MIIASNDLAGLPALEKDTLRIFALGGISEIGRNMTVFEYQGSLLVVDCGVLFPADAQPGVDLILPDFSPIIDRVDDIVAIVVTHGHEDHIGAIPYLLRFRSTIPIVASRFSLALVDAKCNEHGINPILRQVREGQIHNVGPFICKFFAVNHSIPDALAIGITAGNQRVLHTGDIKLDQLPLDGRLTDLGGFARFGDQGVDLLLIDSTNAEVPGFQILECDIGPTLDNLIAKAPRRVLIASFASHIHRIQQIISIAYRHGRKVVFIGRSMVRNMDIAIDLGILDVPEEVLVGIDEAANLPGDKIVIIMTGSQGEPLSALSRIAEGEHKQISLDSDDCVILASSLIPGNENSVYRIINTLSHRGVTVYNQRNAKVHVSGHASAGELLFIYNAVKPKNVMPVHGEWRHLRANAQLAIATGVPESNIVFAENGVVVDLCEGKSTISGKIPVGHVYVDGSSVGDVGVSTLTDRLILGEGGFISVTVAVEKGTGKILSAPTVIAKGFSDADDAFDEVIKLVENKLNQLASERVSDAHYIAQEIRRTVGRWVAQTYRRGPMIVPNVVMVDSFS